MRIDEVLQLDDLDDVVISGQDLKQILHYAKTLNAGFTPKGEECFLWGKSLHGIIERAIDLEGA